MADVSKVKLNGTTYNLKDASVPSWAKQSSKPSYTQDEVGDGNTYKRVTSTEKSTWNNKGTYSKPSGGIPKSDLASAVQTSLGKADTALQSFTETDPTVPSWAKQSSKPSYTASEVGAIATSAKGAANGVASLDSAGKVPSSQLPSYVDDVLEYSAKSSFPSTGETGKIYVDTSTNKTYRWSGSAYVEISASLALGETSSTAYAGDKGKTAYSHATETRLTTATASGLYKVASTAQGHIASLTTVAKADITALGIPAQDTTYGVVSTSANGLAPKVTDTSKFLKGDGTWATPANTWTAMVGATSSANGSVGYVNATPPKDGYNTKYLRADGTWSIPPNTTYSAATQSANGLMSSTDKTKLDGIATGANNYTHPTTSGNKHIPSGGSSGQILRWSADGTATWGSDNNTWTAMVGATSSANGSVGYVNAVPPKDGYNTKYLRADGSWQVPPNTTYSAATTSAAGLMSATDKSKLNGIATGATAVSESTVSGWGFTKNTGTYSKPSTGIPKSDLASAVQTSLGKADSALQSFTETDPTVPSWAKQSSKPSYTQDEVSDGTTYKRVTSTEKNTWNNKGTYSKPSGGIPKSDLASAVQTSLGNADTAYSALSKVSKNIAKVEKSFTSTADVLSSTGCKYTTSSNKIYRITAWAEYSTTNPLAVAIVNSTNGAVFGYAESSSGLTNARVTATALIIGAEVVEIKAKYASSNTCTVGMIVEELCGV